MPSKSQINTTLIALKEITEKREEVITNLRRKFILNCNIDTLFHEYSIELESCYKNHFSSTKLFIKQFAERLKSSNLDEEDHMYLHQEYNASLAALYQSTFTHLFSTFENIIYNFSNLYHWSMNVKRKDNTKDLFWIDYFLHDNDYVIEKNKHYKAVRNIFVHGGGFINPITCNKEELIKIAEPDVSTTTFNISDENPFLLPEFSSLHYFKDDSIFSMYSLDLKADIVNDCYGLAGDLYFELKHFLNNAYSKGNIKDNELIQKFNEVLEITEKHFSLGFSLGIITNKLNQIYEGIKKNQTISIKEKEVFCSAVNEMTSLTTLIRSLTMQGEEPNYYFTINEIYLTDFYNFIAHTIDEIKKKYKKELKKKKAS